MQNIPLITVNPTAEQAPQELELMENLTVYVFHV